MILEELSSLQELESLRPEWTELWQRCPTATPFQSPAWLISWWRHLGQGGLRVLAVWDENTLAALAPFFLWAHPENGERQMLLLGTGITDYLDGLYLPENRQTAIHEIFSALEANEDHC